MTRETRNTTLNIVEEKKKYNNTPGKSGDFFFLNILAYNKVYG